MKVIYMEKSSRCAFVQLVVTSLILCAAGCASLNPSSMVPKSQKGANDNIQMRVSTINVAGGNEIEKVKTKVFVSDEKLKKALLTTMKNEDLLASDKAMGSELNLYLFIKEQNQIFAKGGLKTVFIAEYKLINTNSEETVWCETYHSECSAPDAFKGLEGAIKINLASFVKRFKSKVQWP